MDGWRDKLSDDEYGEGRKVMMDEREVIPQEGEESEKPNDPNTNFSPLKICLFQGLEQPWG